MVTVTCPVCSREQPAGAVVCAACGVALSRPCPRCGRANAPDSNFCSNCGAAVQVETAAPAATPPGDASLASTPEPFAHNLQPRAYTPNHLAERILNLRSAIEGERKQVTVFFVDVKESLHLAGRVGPEDWHRILDRFFAILADGIHRFDGTINQFTGDGVMALFGAPLAHEDHAQRACHAALQLREQVRLYAQELKRARGLTFAVRMGLNSGEVIVGTIGDDLRMDYTAQGHTVGLAARMQQIAEAGAIYLTAHTASLVASFFTLEPVGRVRIRGVREPVRTFALVEAKPIHTRLEASRARGFSSFVGRADEVATLEAALSRAVAGHARVVGVVGAPGVGKSRLCQEVVDRWRAEGLTVAEAHCPAHGRALPYATLLELLRSFFAIPADERAATSRRRVRVRLRGLHRGLEGELPLLLDFLGLPDPKRPPPVLDAAGRRARLSACVCRLLQTQSASAPTVVLVDDAHWIDAESNAILAQLVEAVGWTRTLLLLNFRPEYAADWMRVSYYQQLALAPLASDGADALLHALLSDEEALAAVGAVIKERAAGNPFFIEEIVQALVDQGVLVRAGPARATTGTGERTRLRLAQPIGELRIPATVQSLLAARIDGLPEPVKYVLQGAAVIGKRFGEPVLRLALETDAAASGLSAVPDLASALRTLERADLIRAEPCDGPSEYSFKHPLTQEVAYSSQLQETRTRKHAAVARALEIVHADRLGEYAALLTHHWAAADKRYEAQLWRGRAALRVTTIQVRRERVRRSS
jgi:class 3 adenylate cyclase